MRVKKSVIPQGVTVCSKTLAKLVKIASNFTLEWNSVNPFIELEANDGMMKVSAFVPKNEQVLILKLACKGQLKKVCVHPSVFHKLVRGDKNTTSISIENDKLKVTNGVVMSMPVVAEESCSHIEPDKRRDFSRAVESVQRFKDGFNYCDKARSIDVSKENCNRIVLRSDGLWSTDGYRAANCVFSMWDDQAEQFFFTDLACMVLVDVLKFNLESIYLHHSSDFVVRCIEGEATPNTRDSFLGFELYMRNGNGSFPEVSRAIPEKFRAKVYVATKSLKETLERFIKLMKEPQNGLVLTFSTFEENLIQLTHAEPEEPSIDSEVVATIDSNESCSCEIKVKLNPIYLLDSLVEIEDRELETLTLYVNDDSTPILVKCGSFFQSLIMPVRM